MGRRTWNPPSLLTSTSRTARCGPACRVVWQGRRDNSPPYADRDRASAIKCRSSGKTTARASADFSAGDAVGWVGFRFPTLDDSVNMDPFPGAPESRDGNPFFWCELMGPEQQILRPAYPTSWGPRRAGSQDDIAGVCVGLGTRGGFAGWVRCFPSLDDPTNEDLFSPSDEDLSRGSPSARGDPGDQGTLFARGLGRRWKLRRSLGCANVLS